ncbi:protein FAM124A-like [Haliotis cracherodii]|uniref:protein FAM124A-like n=1 Tax=Haliotis cracherodii TaxID=6455 RepID=UPI0039E7C5CF
METYLQRTYGHKKQATDQRSFPFWDYRSRRGSFSTSTSSSDGSSVSSMSSSRSDAESESVSLSGSDSDSLLQNDPTKLTVQFYADTHEVIPLLDLYQPVLSWIDSDLQLFKIRERSSNTDREETLSEHVSSLAIIVFLHEEGMLGCERIQSARRHFEKPPWKFHHSEQLVKGKINPYPYNSQEFYYTSSDLPLWAVRQVHYGKEHIRLVVYASDENWDDMLDFYKLILGADPELSRSDFCLFTIHAQIHYNVQFALKRLPATTSPKILQSVTLQFKVAEVGHIVPLFPNICRPLCDNRWETTDHDGNSIVLEVTGSSPNTSLDKSFSRLTTLDSSLDRSHGQMSLSSSSRSSVCSNKEMQQERTLNCSSFKEQVQRNSFKEAELRNCSSFKERDPRNSFKDEEQISSFKEREPRNCSSFKERDPRNSFKDGEPRNCSFKERDQRACSSFKEQEHRHNDLNNSKQSKTSLAENKNSQSDKQHPVIQKDHPHSRGVYTDNSQPYNSPAYYIDAQAGHLQTESQGFYV